MCHWKSRSDKYENVYATAGGFTMVSCICMSVAIGIEMAIIVVYNAITQQAIFGSANSDVFVVLFNAVFFFIIASMSWRSFTEGVIVLNYSLVTVLITFFGGVLTLFISQCMVIQDSTAFSYPPGLQPPIADNFSNSAKTVFYFCFVFEIFQLALAIMGISGILVARCNSNYANELKCAQTRMRAPFGVGRMPTKPSMTNTTTPSSSIISYRSGPGSIEMTTYRDSQNEVSRSTSETLARALLNKPLLLTPSVPAQNVLRLRVPHQPTGGIAGPFNLSFEIVKERIKTLAMMKTLSHLTKKTGHHGLWKGQAYAGGTNPSHSSAQEYSNPFANDRAGQSRMLVADIIAPEYKQNPNNLLEAIPSSGDPSAVINVRDLLLPLFVLDENDKRYAIVRAKPLDPNEPQTAYYRALNADVANTPMLGLSSGLSDRSSDAASRDSKDEMSDATSNATTGGLGTEEDDEYTSTEPNETGDPTGDTGVDVEVSG